MVDSVKGVNTCINYHTAGPYKRVQNPTSGHIPLVRENVTIEEKQKQAEAKKNYDKYKSNGKLNNDKPKLKYVQEKKFLGITYKGPCYFYTPGKNSETFGGLKERLNLPDGTFAEHLRGYNGVNRDLYLLAGPVSIPAPVLHKAIGGRP
ncbi:MAG: hypothetical protein WCG95_07100 [bacterium]